MTIAPGLTATMLFLVEKADTAAMLGSGDVPILGTPRLLAFAEAATVQAVRDHLEPGQTTVGTRVELEHLAACPVGAHVELSAELTKVDGRRLVFGFTATERATLVGSGTIERVVVDRARFLARATS
ncbi:putative thioesterase [Thermocatellispora tengchongensis]|uniref:Putative thioesterase n=1 Tax=Thermocatellispora tengchongensis TaxID=1073253 RepID=A0A840P5I0_9ACTN|nr:hotdog domain-containing protein [Thermocatellispora tengchongensis]MBB5132730.1 putative thioesterase [Thermocatellispora tengchongensis]